MVFPGRLNSQGLDICVLQIHFQALSQQAEVQAEFMIPPDQLLIISAGAGLGLLLLIIITVVMWKVRLRLIQSRLSNPRGNRFILSLNASPQLGCFKSKGPHQFEEEEEPGRDGTSPAPTKESLSQSEPEQKLEQPREEKPLLDDTNRDVPKGV